MAVRDDRGDMKQTTTGFRDPRSHICQKHIPILLSVVIPCFNEGPNVLRLFGALTQVLNSTGVDFEIICINDGSTDDTLLRLEAQQANEPSLKIIDLSRNFGKEIALTAGLDHVTGDMVLIMDADLQHPPDMIPQFLEKIAEGYDVVYGLRINRDKTDRAGHNILVKLFYKILDYSSETKIPENSSDFRLMTRQVVEALKSLPERKRFMKGLYAWVGFNQTHLPFEAPPRNQGSSKWSSVNLMGLAIDGIVSFTTMPLRLWSWLGVIIASLSALCSIVIIIQTLFFGIDIPGYATLATAIFFLSGVQLISIGVLGEYISRIFIEVKNRPLYLIKRLDKKKLNNENKKE